MQSLIAGYGYAGKHLAAILKKKNIEFVVASRSVEASTHALSIDLDHEIAPIDFEHIWYFVPPAKEHESDIRLQHFLSSLPDTGKQRRIVYISTTGVYGNCHGAWVKETRPTNPITNRAKRRVDAEQQLRKWSKNEQNEHVILRVAGIYGPDRLPIERLKNNLPFLAENEAPWSNRIHITDLARICFAAMYKAEKNEILNVADNQPSNMASYFNQFADIAKLPRPPIVTLANHDGQISTQMLSYLTESRRISNEKVLRTLSLELKYPSLAEGLPAAWAEHERDDKQ